MSDWLRRYHHASMPDRMHEANISRGAPYGVFLPPFTVDATFVGVTTGPFVEYLNNVCASGGFPAATGAAGTGVRRSSAQGLLRL